MPTRTTSERVTETRSSALIQPLRHGDAAGRALLAITCALVAMGTVFVASASEGQSAANGGSTFSIMIHDAAYLALGVIALYVAARIRLPRLIARAPLLIALGVALLVAVRVVGASANGATRWLNLRVINLQPSELFKLATILFVAWLVEHHHRELNDWKRLALRSAPITLGCLLVVLEPDLGTASVILVIAVAMLAVAGLSTGLLARIALLTGAGVGVYLLAEPYSARRFFSFLHANTNLLGSGYQLLQSRIGLGAGGVTGLGLGHSREKWGLLPNPHTDFIFTIVGEEWGLVGTLMVLALFIAFVVVALRIAQRSPNAVNRLIAVGITAWIAVEAIINVASVVGWWAVTGVPLPFFSYGGTALIAELFAVGLLYNIAHDRRRGPAIELGVTHHQRERVHHAPVARRAPRPRATTPVARPQPRRARTTPRRVPPPAPRRAPVRALGPRADSTKRRLRGR